MLLDADGGGLQPGEVLVTTVTNVGWTPLFPRAAAVVTDVGAPLSHAAIVARELGIPAVVGCGTATMLLRPATGPGGRHGRHGGGLLPDRSSARSSRGDGRSTQVAPTLLGAMLRHDDVAVRLTEVEAYDGARDPASHAFRGRTARNASCSVRRGTCTSTSATACTGPRTSSADRTVSRPGSCCGPARWSREWSMARSRRGRSTDRDLARGPGRLTQALGLNAAHKGCDLCRTRPVRLEPAVARPKMIMTGPRVGVSVEADRPWRFWDADSRAVSDYKRSPRAPVLRPGKDLR